jgi:hypothetical protein
MAYGKLILTKQELLNSLYSSVNKYIQVNHLRSVMNVNRDLRYIEHRIEHVRDLYFNEFKEIPIVYIEDLTHPEYSEFDILESKLAKIIKFEEIKDGRRI